MNTDTLLRVTDLAVTLDDQPLLSGVSFTIGRGETLGIVGESGSGKSLTAAAITGLLPSTLSASGEVKWRGAELLEQSERDLRAVRGSGIALVLQDPFTSLHPRMRCGDSVVELLRNPDGSRLSRAQAAAEARRRLEEVGITDPSVAERYPFQLSGGMLQRVALAATLAQDPQLLIADEPTTALDVTTQAEILALLSRIQRDRGMAMIFITHDLRVAFDICERIQVFYAGTSVESAPAAELQRQPLHPYSLGLCNSLPPVHGRAVQLAGIPGTVPRAAEVAGQCGFASRCDWATEVCRGARPALAEVSPGRRSACARLPEIQHELVQRTQLPLEPITQHGAESRAPLLTVTEVRKSYGDRPSSAVEVLRGVTIDIAAGESVGLVGESGSGKTTLGRCIVGLETVSDGTISLAGVDLSDRSRLPKLVRNDAFRLAQMVFQDPKSSLDPTQTIGAGLAQLLARVGVARADRRAAARGFLERVGLGDEHLDRFPRHLSGGQRQRVAIARALTADPKLLICDEPVSALDVSIQAQILNLFNELRADTDISMLFISHDLAVVRQVVDRVYVLYRGEIVESGDVNDVFDRPQHPYTQRLVSSVVGGTPQ